MRVVGMLRYKMIQDSPFVHGFDGAKVQQNHPQFRQLTPNVLQPVDANLSSQIPKAITCEHFEQGVAPPFSQSSSSNARNHNRPMYQLHRWNRLWMLQSAEATAQGGRYVHVSIALK